MRSSTGRGTLYRLSFDQIHDLITRPVLVILLTFHSNQHGLILRYKPGMKELDVLSFNHLNQFTAGYISDLDKLWREEEHLTTNGGKSSSFSLPSNIATLAIRQPVLGDIAALLCGSSQHVYTKCTRDIPSYTTSNSEASHLTTPRGLAESQRVFRWYIAKLSLAFEKSGTTLNEPLVKLEVFVMMHSVFIMLEILGQKCRRRQENVTHLVGSVMIMPLSVHIPIVLVRVVTSKASLGTWKGLWEIVSGFLELASKPTSPKERKDADPGPLLRLLLLLLFVVIWMSEGFIASKAYIVTCRKLFDANITAHGYSPLVKLE